MNDRSRTQSFSGTEVDETPGALGTRSTKHSDNPNSPHGLRDCKGKKATLQVDENISSGHPLPDSNSRSPGKKVYTLDLLVALLDMLYDGFDAKIGRRLTDFNELLELFDNFVKFLNSVERVFDILVIGFEDKVSKVAADVLTRAIRLKLDLPLTEPWQDKLECLRQCHSVEEYKQGLWKAQFVTPAAIIAKLFSIYHPETIPNSKKDAISFEKYWEFFWFFPLNHELHSNLLPVVLLGDWPTARELGTARIEYWKEHCPDDWFIKPRPTIRLWTNDNRFCRKPTIRPSLLNKLELEETAISERPQRPFKNNMRRRKGHRRQRQQCTTKYLSTKGKSRKGVYCYRCEGFGHKVKVCTSPQSTRRFRLLLN